MAVEAAHLDDFAIPAMTLLFEQNGPRGREFHRDGNYQQDWAEADKCQERQATVQYRLTQRCGGVAGQRAFIEMNGG